VDDFGEVAIEQGKGASGRSDPDGQVVPVQDEDMTA
jgi:hypothetical protein